MISAQWYTVVADEVTDCSNKEQLSLVLRYVDPETLLIREDFVDFLECDIGITGQQLADKITSSLQSYGLDLKHLHGQAYVMLQARLGVQQLSSHLNTLSLFTHTVLHTV